MKKIIYLSAVLFLSVSFLNATNIKKVDVKKNQVKIEKIVKKQRYRGRCLDGTTFTFTASNLDEAQGYVNGYCAALR